jgi:SAM-dependent methyltransferase
MERYGPSTYGDRWADIYDEWTDERIGASTQATVDGLADLAAGGRVLELAIGTGRIALGLVARGIEVHGIDSSEAMVARLRDKPGGDAVPVTIGDFADVDADGSFDLVFVAFNTFFALTTQNDQVRCFHNVARRLTDDGVFVIEAFVPDLGRFNGGQTVRALRVTTGLVDLEASTHDAATQTVSSQHVVITQQGLRLQPVHLRYAWPSELDLMARLAGLTLRQRWSGWDRSAFTSSSGQHVSVYGRRAPA